MKNKFIGIWTVLILAFMAAFAACASPTAPPTALPAALPDAPPVKKALQFYEFYSPM